jgi:hypothetical protein
MKKIILIGLLAYSMGTFAQRKIEKTIVVPANHTISMDFDFPELIQIHTWDKKEILIRGEVSINHGENDDAFELTASTTNNVVNVTSKIKNLEQLPRRIVIKKGDQEYFFKTGDFNHPDVVKFMNENGGNYQYTSQGIIKTIKLEIFVPQGVATNIVSKFGLVEIKDFNAPLVVDAKHGGIDAVIQKAGMGELTAKTEHGEILTNLDAKFDVSPAMKQKHTNWTEIKARLGTGHSFYLESTFGKVYLRKPSNP